MGRSSIHIGISIDRLRNVPKYVCLCRSRILREAVGEEIDARCSIELLDFRVSVLAHTITVT